MPNFGEETVKANSADFGNAIGGSVHTCTLGGVGDSITVWTQCYGAGRKMKAALYSADRTTLIGTTEEINLVEDELAWKTLNFSPKPTLVAGTNYYIVAWSNLTAWGKYGTSAGITLTWGTGETYNGWPANISGDWSGADTTASIYCTYTGAAGAAGTLSLFMGMGTGIQTKTKGGKLPRVTPGHKPNKIGF